MMRATLSMVLALVLAGNGAQALAQSNIVLVNDDPADAGLNDPTPVKPIGGNPGRTLGEQRTIAFQYAADLWGALLGSDIDIRVEAGFSPMDCNILGGARALSMHKDFPGAPLVGLEYPAAMANALAGEDLAPNRNDIATTYNSARETAACPDSTGWFYGLYGNGDNAEDGSNFLNVLMHEIGHGLGVAGGLSRFGDYLFGSTPAAYNQFAVSNQFGQTINDLSSDQLRTALTTIGDVVWTGSRANASTGLIADNRVFLSVDAPEASAGRYELTMAEFGNTDVGSVPAGEVVLVQDAGAETSLGCDGVSGQPEIGNPEAIAGKIALIDRGECDFSRKAFNAQRHGAIAVIIANSDDAVHPGMRTGDSGDEVTIPVLSVSSSTGARLRGHEPVRLAGAAVDADLFYGLDPDGRTRLYVNTEFEGGSTLSHIDTDMSPNALMEPAETPTLESHIFIDVTLDVYEDLGWRVNRNGTAVLGDCDTGIPVVRDVGFIPGANLMAQQNVCEVAARGSRAGYQRCMSDHALKLRDDGHIDNAEVQQVRQCLARGART